MPKKTSTTYCYLCGSDKHNSSNCPLYASTKQLKNITVTSNFTTSVWMQNNYTISTSSICFLPRN
ncbi:hypothetical protein BDC45DRAFT_496595 [Circinella umbellata]|nr:hypothetical protein BDC45DRAFT_496595 [Circinella umbellata]